MKLSFEDQESLKEAAGSLCFNNLPSDPVNILRMETLGSTSTSNGMPPRGQESEYI